MDFLYLCCFFCHAFIPAAEGFELVGSVSELDHTPVYFHNTGKTSTTTSAVEVQLQFDISPLLSDCVKLQEVMPDLLHFTHIWRLNNDMGYFNHVISNACGVLQHWGKSGRTERNVMGWAGTTFLSAIGLNTNASPTSEGDIIHALTLEESQMGRLHGAYKQLEKTSDYLSASVRSQETSSLVRFQATQLATHTVELTRAIEGISREGKLPPHSLLLGADVRNLIANIHKNYSVPEGEYKSLLYSAPAQIKFGKTIVFSVFLPIITDTFEKFKVLDFPIFPKGAHHGVPLIWKSSAKREIAVSALSNTYFYPEDTLTLRMGNMEFSFPTVLNKNLSSSCLGQLVTKNRTNLPICPLVIFKRNWAAVPVGEDTVLLYNKILCNITVSCKNIKPLNLLLKGTSYVTRRPGCTVESNNFLLPATEKGSIIVPVNVSFPLTFQEMFPNELELNDDDVASHTETELDEADYEETVTSVNYALKKAKSDEFYYWMACGIVFVVAIIVIFLIIHCLVAICAVRNGV